jgi:hypothetical protein
MTNEREVRLDRMLDAALGEYGAAEPLAGLEERVLGRLREEKLARPWWVWGAVATAAAMVLVVLLLTTRSEKVSAPPVVKSAPQPTSVTPAHPPEQSAKSAPIRKPVRASRAQEAAQDLPKRDVFPTPEPPGEQELLLAKYMRRTPREEVLTVATRPPLTELPKDPLETPASEPGGGNPPMQKFGR